MYAYQAQNEQLSGEPERRKKKPHAIVDYAIKILYSVNIFILIFFIGHEKIETLSQENHLYLERHRNLLLL